MTASKAGASVEDVRAQIERQIEGANWSIHHALKEVRDGLDGVEEALSNGAPVPSGVLPYEMFITGRTERLTSLLARRQSLYDALAWIEELVALKGGDV